LPHLATANITHLDMYNTITGNVKKYKEFCCYYVPHYDGELSLAGDRCTER